MCGIAGIISPGLSAEARGAAVGRMCEAMLHRGPNDAGLDADGPATLGMRRLAIFDPANGHQPMITPDGRYRIVFNGAVYNFGTIRPSFTSAGILPYSWAEGVANLALVETWFAPRSWLLVSWSLDYEVGFYALAALALALMAWRRSAWPGLAFGAAAAALPFFAPAILLFPLFPQFALGGVAWLLLHRLPGGTARRALVALVLGGAVWWLARPDGGAHRASLRCAAATCTALVLLHPHDTRIARLRPLRWLGWIGTISYSLYLTHAPVVGKARNLLLSFGPPNAPAAFLAPLAACLFALVAAAVFYFLVEAPLQRLRRRLVPPHPSPA